MMKIEYEPFLKEKRYIILKIIAYDDFVLLKI